MNRYTEPELGASALITIDMQRDTLDGQPLEIPGTSARSAGSNFGLHHGRDVMTAHGTMEMPVWGDAFKSREGLNDQSVKARIEAIVRYLASIQERSS